MRLINGVQRIGIKKIFSCHTVSEMPSARRSYTKGHSFSRVAMITLRVSHERTFQRQGRDHHGGGLGYRSRRRRTLLQGRGIGLRRRSQSGDLGETAASRGALAATFL